MANNKKPRKAYKPRAIKLHQSIGVVSVLHPLEQIIDQLDTYGTLTATEEGSPVFRLPTGEFADTAYAVGGLIQHMEIIGGRVGVELPLEPLRQFHAGLAVFAPVTDELLAGMRRSMSLLQAFLNRVPHELHVDAIRTVQIRQEMEELV